jgi:DnaK suppressor protein
LDRFVCLENHGDVKGDKRPALAYADLMTDPIPLDLARTEARLEERRRELRELTASHHDETRPVEVDQTQVGRLSRMDALQAQEMAAATERRRQFELDRIDAALQRIASGEFGFCVRCGENIGLERLEFDPTTPLCIACARQTER